MVETHLKDNFIDWISVKPEERLLILSENMDNLEGMWDYIIVSDAFAKVPAYIAGKDAYQRFFEKIKKHLNPGGHVILAVDNKYGLTYFAGSKERLTGRYFEGLEGYGNSEGVATFSKDAVLSMVREAGFVSVKTYYPYPNYRYMTALYTEEHLPSVGELTKNLCNFEEERMTLFDETKVFDELIKEGRFQEFSNSYLFDLTLEAQKEEEEILFVKYSVDRDERYRIRTEIVKKSDGTKVVRKVPYGDLSISHVEQMKVWEEELKKQYESSGVLVNECTLTDKGAEFEFIKGETLESVLDGYLENNDFAGFTGEIIHYKETLEKMLCPKPFVAGERFREIFGKISFDTPQMAGGLNNIDLIFPNILLKDGKWNIIDYEWTFDFQIPVKFIIHRALVLYCEHRKEKGISCEQLCRMLGISEGEEKIFLEMEHRLQVYLLGETKTMEALQQEYAGKIIDVKEILHRAHRPEMKIYEDCGQGFSEEHSYVLEAEEDFYGRRRFTLNIPQGVTALRLDPCEEPCMVTVNRILGECGGSYELQLGHNGKAYEKSILYTTTDPQILITGIVPGTGQIHVDLTVEYFKEETGYLWMKLLSKAEKLDRIENSKPYRFLRKIKKLVKKGNCF